MTTTSNPAESPQRTTRVSKRTEILEQRVLVDEVATQLPQLFFDYHSARFTPGRLAQQHSPK